jgi:hypothetical protein
MVQSHVYLTLPCCRCETSPIHPHAKCGTADDGPCKPIGFPFLVTYIHGAAQVSYSSTTNLYYHGPCGFAILSWFHCRIRHFNIYIACSGSAWRRLHHIDRLLCRGPCNQQPIGFREFIRRYTLLICMPMYSNQSRRLTMQISYYLPVVGSLLIK